MVLPERPELAFRPHNLQSNQLSTPESIALYDAAARASVTEVRTINTSFIIRAAYSLVSTVVSTILAHNYGDCFHLNLMIYELAGEDTACCWWQPQLVSPFSHVLEWLSYIQGAY